MKFLYQSFEAKRKEIIEVEIDVPTKVKFMTARELKAYRQGKTHTYHGGMFEESPVRFVIPFDSIWTVVVEKGSYDAPIAVKASCSRMSPNSLAVSSIAIDAPPEVRDQAMLNSIADAEQHAAEISMASKSEG
ncbi:MAG: DUF1883 domain-containing protein [Flavobacteriales bacterium]|jgi:hypothetical protein|nr:DUF1883 domain-containing protein [Flavobacteriales bacterium]MBK6551102.1 DUF1883 domain-containing protein [Flavobacteriales bacterium]MBK6883634.1 DUF1883 domain-containing protein [Flavobacteriales bacterium]MBK7101109.1 DUF1883 domain-containing protein [Flavobacteriales bacterium]MBK7111832.1 DUF1883 domain-containing protein [Flavobacteriales bacterium]